MCSEFFSRIALARLFPKACCRSRFPAAKICHCSLSIEWCRGLRGHAIAKGQQLPPLITQSAPAALLFIVAL